MRLPAVLPFLLALAGPTAAGTPDEPPRPRAALKGADCLDASRIRSWHYVDGNELLVDAGRRKYRITLAESCTDLGSAASITFRGDSVSGRVCGNFGERVVTGRMACRIDRVEMIDGEVYREATGTPKGSVSAATTLR